MNLPVRVAIATLASCRTCTTFKGG